MDIELLKKRISALDPEKCRLVLKVVVSREITTAVNQASAASRKIGTALKPVTESASSDHLYCPCDAKQGGSCSCEDFCTCPSAMGGINMDLASIYETLARVNPEMLTQAIELLKARSRRGE